MKNNFQEKNNDLNDIDFQLLQIFLKYAQKMFGNVHLYTVEIMLIDAV